MKALFSSIMTLCLFSNLSLCLFLYNGMVGRIRRDTVPYLQFHAHYSFLNLSFYFIIWILNLEANILATKVLFSNLGHLRRVWAELAAPRFVFRPRTHTWKITRVPLINSHLCRLSEQPLNRVGVNPSGKCSLLQETGKNIGRKLFFLHTYYI